MKSNHFALVGLLVSFLFAAGGCASSVSIPAWQKSVESYVKQQGGGDPNVLRNATWSGTHRGFSIISKDYPGTSTDANGVLLAHEKLLDHAWFVFLVGIIDKQKVTDIRAAALAAENGKFTWHIGKKDESALKAYRAYNDRLWHERFPGRKDAPTDYLGFPREEDVFEVKTQGDDFQISHPPSGAQWETNVARGKK